MPPERVLITGASGFVGRHLILRLLGDSGLGTVQLLAGVLPAELDSARAWADSAAPASGPPRLTWHTADITEPGAAKEIIREFRPDRIVHLAARASGVDADREAVFQVNVEGTRMLLQAAGSASSQPKTLLVSTGYAYGPTSPDRPAVETDPLSTPGAYGAYTDSKIAMESMASEFSSNTIIARSFSHTGPGQTPVFAIPSFARQLARIERELDPPSISVGNLEALRDMLDVRDVVRAYQLLLQLGVAGEIYNVGSGCPYRMRTLLEMMIAQVSTPIEIVEDPERLRPADISCSTGDSTKLRLLTGWQPEIQIEETMRDTLNYWRSQLAGRTPV